MQYLTLYTTYDHSGGEKRAKAFQDLAIFVYKVCGVKTLTKLLEKEVVGEVFQAITLACIISNAEKTPAHDLD